MASTPRLARLAAAVAVWMLAAAASAGVEAGDPPLSPKGLNYEGAPRAVTGVSVWKVRVW
jgi:hypothetical protein